MPLIIIIFTILKVLGVYLNKNLFKLGRNKQGVVRSILLTGVRAETFIGRQESKERKLFDCLELKYLSYLDKSSWLFMTDYP